MSIEQEYLSNELELQKEFKNATIYLNAKNQAVVIKSIGTYITIEEFKSIFEEAYLVIKKNNLKKTIFDKRSLKVFHQPSMEWYFVDWKDRLFDLGIKKHIKILPDDNIFRSSVKVGRQKIDGLYPNAKYKQTEILYFDNLSAALVG